MTIDEIMRALATHKIEFDGVWIGAETCEAIMKALRSGQAVTEKLRALYEGGDICGVTRAHEDKINRQVNEVLEAWEDATSSDQP